MELNKNLTIITLNTPGIVDFAAARNVELAKAKTDWVLFLDYDETMSKELEHEITSILNLESNIYSAYSVPRLDTFLGRELHHGEPGNTRLIRLAKKDFGLWERPVHEVWVGTGKVGTLQNPLLHHSHESINSFLDKINKYSELEADYRYSQGIRSSLWKITVYQSPSLNGTTRPSWLLDGVPGIIMAIMMSFHSYLT